FFGNTFWQLKNVLDGILGQLSHIQKQKQALEEKSSGLRQEVEKLENVSQSGGEKFKEIQEELNKLQHQKNKLLEDLSLVRGKMQSQKTAVTGDAQSLQVEVHGRQRK